MLLEKSSNIDFSHRFHIFMEADIIFFQDYLMNR